MAWQFSWARSGWLDNVFQKKNVERNIPLGFFIVNRSKIFIYSSPIVNRYKIFSSYSLPSSFDQFQKVLYYSLPRFFLGVPYYSISKARLMITHLILSIQIVAYSLINDRINGFALAFILFDLRRENFLLWLNHGSLYFSTVYILMQFLVSNHRISSSHPFCSSSEFSKKVRLNMSNFFDYFLVISRAFPFHIFW